MTLLSKELLSEVLDIDKVDNVELFAGNKWNNAIKQTMLISCNDGSEPIAMNIYELAHKCKEWISIQGYVFLEDTRGFSKVSRFGTDKIKFWEDSEYNFKRVFTACKYILENKDR